MTVILASIHYGITNKIKPIEPTVGNAFDDECEALPLKLDRALVALEQDQILTSYLGEAFTKNYHTVKQKELEQFDMHISELEVKWYLSNS